VSDVDIAVAESLKVLDLNWPIREADIVRPPRHVRSVPILLQKSFGGVEGKFLEPLVRFTRGDVRDHIV